MPGKNATRTSPDRGRVWNLNDIQDLLDLLARKEITEFEMEQEGVKIRVRRGDSSPVAAGNLSEYGMVPGAAPQAPSSPPAPGIPRVPPPTAPSAAPPTADAAGESTEGLLIIKSPIVGTYYSSPSPGATAFVKVGDFVQVGQVICIIEAMKLMNELEAEVAGQIVRIYVENGQPVEYGQSLFAIEPARKK